MSNKYLGEVGAKHLWAKFVSKLDSHVKEKVLIKLTSNLNEPIYTIVNVNINNTILTYDYNNEPINIDIPAGSTYSLSFGNLEGYTTPIDSNTYIANTGTTRNINFEYKSCILTVNIAGITNGTATVKFTDAVIGQKNVNINSGGTVQVPWSQVTISAPDIDGYKTPSNIIFTPNSSSITKTMTYEEIVAEIKIMDTSGNLIDVDSWAGGTSCTGISLVTDEHSIIIAPATAKKTWGSAVNISALASITNVSGAYTDLNGSSNTDEILKQRTGSNNSALAAEYCRSYSKGYKGKGLWYLPSAGESKVIMDNKAAIENALNKVSGALFNVGDVSEWTSTQYDTTYAWSNLAGNYTQEKKSLSRITRPICRLNDQTGQIIWFKIDNVKHVGTYGQTFANWVSSSYNKSSVYLSGTQVHCSNNQKISSVSSTTVLTSGKSYTSAADTVTLDYGSLSLNNQWRSSSKTNPDSSKYLIYESNSNYNKHESYSIMSINITGLTSFTCYIRSYAESNYDYVMISQLDKVINGDTSYNSATLVKAHTRGKQTSGTSLDNYIKVTYDNISSGSHTINVVYRKDSSQNTGDDRGYILIPIDPNSESGSPETPDPFDITWEVQSGTWNSSNNSNAYEGLQYTCESPGDDGETTIRCYFSGVTQISFECVSNGEDTYDYLTAGNIDTNGSRDDYYISFDEYGAGYEVTVTYNCGPGSHYVDFCYSKDGSVADYEDNATVYVKSFVQYS